MLRYNVVTFLTRNIASAADASQYCASGLEKAPLLILELQTHTKPPNNYTSGIRYDYDILGYQLHCVTPNKMTVIGQPTIDAAEDHVYYPNPFDGLYVTLALLSSPWINHYKLWITAPSTFLSAFEHDSDVQSGTLYCAAASALSIYLSQDTTKNWLKYPTIQRGRQDTKSLDDMRVSPNYPFPDYYNAAIKREDNLRCH